MRGAVQRAQARQTPDWRLALAVIVGSIPIAVVGLAAKHFIEGPLRSLWVVAVALILWSGGDGLRRAGGDPAAPRGAT